jgi:poly(3-hydroxybutyrate) depolymerase
MRCFFLFLFISLLLPLTAEASTAKIVKDSIVSQDKKRTFYLFVPETVKGANPAPLIVLLHGSGRNGLSLVEKWKELASKEGIILVGPDAADPSHWSLPGDGPNFLHELVETLKSKYPINPRRVYLFGHSAGATFALYMSLFGSEYFAATAIHAGALNQDDSVLIDFAKRKIPITIFIGTKDQFFPLPAVRATRDVLNARGFAVELTEMPGHDHWYYDLAPKINLNAWEFLKKHELTEDPRYKPYP